ncbi:rhamnan synthesis F family protein [Tateyamaria armeniaca]|uniref:Rhamnan synthesis F family protein n=1 Tax=Tateyamaria armeniaca TaxID=2518930 RepID=A0ABW8URD4_9RHOB
MKREIFRIGRSIKAAPVTAATFLFSTIYYDRVLSRKRRVWDGAQSWSDRVAVYVIYPSDGLLATHLTTLRHVAASGYATVVVSNLPLSDSDRQQVLDLCVSYIERPNFGYDFGAYRDGVLSVSDRFADLTRLALLNDSAWYPLPDKRNWLHAAEEMGHDLVGATSNYGTPRHDIADFMDIEWSYSVDHRNFHYGSFALSFGPKILKDPAFFSFWKRMRLDNNKKRVVRRGEIAMSQWVVQRGYTHQCIFDPATLETALDALSDDRLAELTNDIILPEHFRAIDAKHKVLEISPTDPERRTVFTKFILTCTSLQGASYALPDLTILEKDYPFLKKSPLRLSKDGADTTLRILAKMSGPDIDDIVAEAKAIYNPRAAPPPKMTGPPKKGG